MKSDAEGWIKDLELESEIKITVKLHMGSDTNLINGEDIESILSNQKLKIKSMSEDTGLVSYTYNKIKTYHEIKLPCKSRNDIVIIEFYITDKKSIRNRDDCVQLKLIKRTDLVEGKNILEYFEDVFQGLGFMHPERKYRIELIRSSINHTTIKTQDEKRSLRH